MVHASVLERSWVHSFFTYVEGGFLQQHERGALQLAQVPAFRCLTPREDEGNGGTVRKKETTR